MTMAAFVDGLRGMFGANLGVNPVLDQTGLSGIWNFDFKFSIGLNLPTGLAGERLTISEAIDKQLGLKLEEQKVSTPVIVVDQVNKKPTENLPNIEAKALLESSSVRRTFNCPRIECQPM